MSDARFARRIGGGAIVSVLIAGLGAVLPACSDNKLPGAPTDLTEGVVIYRDANFLGASAHVTADIRNLHPVTGPCEKSDGDDIVDTWDDCVSSIRVAPGWRATLYEDPDFKGWAADVGEENVNNYQLVRGPCSRDTFNDCASSIRVFRK
jgi:Peptidase inhibitor family I36